MIVVSTGGFGDYGGMWTVIVRNVVADKGDYIMFAKYRLHVFFVNRLLRLTNSTRQHKVRPAR